MNLEKIIQENGVYIQNSGFKLIETTPEHWKSFYVIAVVSREEDGVHKIAVSLGSNEGLKDLVMPTDELNESMFKLIEVFDRRIKISKFRIDVFQNESGGWRLETDVSSEKTHSGES